VTLHQAVGFSDFPCLLNELHLTRPCFVRPRKFDDQVVAISDLVGIRRVYVLSGLPPSSCRTCRAAGKIDPAIDGIVSGEDMDCIVILERGFKDGRRGRIPFWVDRRPLELGEKPPPRQVKPLDDEEDQEEVGQIVKDVEAPRSDNVLPVRPGDV